VQWAVSELPTKIKLQIKIDCIIKRHGRKSVILDQATSLDSTYLMLELILELKSIWVDMSSLQVNLSTMEWD